MDPEVKKQTLRLLTYGLYVLTAAADEDVAAGTVTWLSQASFSPSLVMVGVKADSGLHAIIERGGVFAVNILAADQQEVASAFFRPSQVEGNRINGFVFEPGPETGALLLADLPAWFVEDARQGEARLTDAVKLGDPYGLLAEVVNAGLRDAQAKPLVMWSTGWSYGG